MQKKVLKINDFSGGLNDLHGGSDIKENQSQALTNFDVTKKGFLRTVGGLSTDESLNSETFGEIMDTSVNQLGPDFNLEMFSTDVKRNNTVSADSFLTFVNTAADIQSCWKSNNWADEDLDDVGDGLGNNINASSGISGFTGPVDITQGTGAVRYTNGDFSVANTTSGSGSTRLWFGSIKRHFCNSTFDLDDYFILPSEIFPPDSTTVLNGVHNNDLGSTHLTHTAGQFSIEVDEGTSSVTGDEGYEINTPAKPGSLTVKDSIFYMTFTYDDKQESLPYKCGPHITSVSGNSDYAGYDGNRAFRIKFTWYPYGVSGGSVSNTAEPIQFEKGGPRITHVNIYRNRYSSGDTSSFAKYNFEYVTSFNLERGWKSRDGSWTPFGFEGTDTLSNGVPDNGIYNVVTGWFSASFTQNFRMRSGFSPTEDSIAARWKTSTRVRNTLYIGNVFMKDEFGVDKHYPDRMIKCIPGKYDTFPQSKRIDVSIDDGESIVKLMSYAGKILQFKERTLNIINATKEFEFLEKVEKNMGIEYPCAAAELKSGIAFANRLGLFVYNGKEVVTLLKERRDRRFWTEWYTGATLTGSGEVTNIVVSLLPKENKILVQRATDGQNTAIEGLTAYIFDIETQSWSYMADGNHSTQNETTDKFMGSLLSNTISKGFLYKGDFYQPYHTYDGDDAIDHLKIGKWKDRRGNEAINTLKQPVEYVLYESKQFDGGSEALVKKFRRLQIRYKNAQLNNADGTTQSYTDGDVIENLDVKVRIDGVTTYVLREENKTEDGLVYENNWTDKSYVYVDGGGFYNTKIPFKTISVIIESSLHTENPQILIDNFEVVYTEKRLK